MFQCFNRGLKLRLKIILSIMLLAMAGCSIGSQPYSYGYNNNNTLPVGLPKRLDGSFAATNSQNNAPGKSTSAKPTASRNAVTTASHIKTPKGALGGRDYSQTRLDVDSAAQLINDYRRQHGLKPIRLNVLLTKAAKQHSRDLAKWDRISHFGSDGSNPLDRIRSTGYSARTAAENVGTGQQTFEEVMAGWKKSSGHSKNLLLRNAKHIGLALVVAPGTEFQTFWTMVIAAPA